MTRLTILSLLLMASAGCASRRELAPCTTTLDAKAPGNFAPVTDAAGKGAGVYRGGALSDCREYRFLAEQGIHHILQLDATREQRRLGPDIVAGFVTKPFAFSALTVASADRCAEVAEALGWMSDPSNWPVYVHCTAGRDRTGYIIGLYERLLLGKSSVEVSSELASHGHRGFWRAVMPGIHKQLASDDPACAPAIRAVRKAEGK